MSTKLFWAVIIGCFLFVTNYLVAEELDADKTEELLFRGPWQIQAGGPVDYFIWKSDGSLCVKLYDPKADKCDDTGTWHRDGNKVCYKLPWWGKGEGLHDVCFQVNKAEDGKFIAMDGLGLTLLTFTLQGGE